MSPLLCVDPDCRPGDPRQAAPGLRLCYPCRDRLARHATALGDLHHQLLTNLPGADHGAPLTPEQAAAPLVVPDHPVPIRLAVADLRDRIAGALASWCRVVTEDRGLDGPTTADPAHTGPWLARHATWLAAQPFAHEAAAELAELHRSARHHTDPARTARPTLPAGMNTCPECGQADLRVFISRDDGHTSRVECGHCASEWESHQWLRLGRRIIDGMEATA